MINVEYYLTTGQKSFIDFAEAISEATNEQVTVVDNKLQWPPHLAEGTLEFHELEEGLSLISADYKLHKEINFIRKGNINNDYYYLVFNISNCPLTINKQNGRIVSLGKDKSKAVLFSSSAMGLSHIAPIKNNFRGINLIIHRTWAIKHLLKKTMPFQTNRLKQFVQHLPMQFSCTLDLSSKNIIEEIFNCQLRPEIKKLCLLGNALRLFALFSKNIVEDTVENNHIFSDGAMRIMQIKESLENNIESILSVEEFARHCHMGKTRFVHLFKTIYGTTYLEMFKEIRLKKAAELLADGKSISTVGHSIGYNNLGYFAKSFKEQYGITPKLYQKEITGNK